MGNASKVTLNRLHFLCACSLQTSKPAGYSSSVADRKWERQIRECQINADGRQWEAQNMWLHGVKLSVYFFPCLLQKHLKSLQYCCYSRHKYWGESEWHVARYTLRQICFESGENAEELCSSVNESLKQRSSKFENWKLAEFVSGFGCQLASIHMEIYFNK